MRVACLLVPTSILLIAVASCAAPPRVGHGPGETALALFDLAQADEPTETELEILFEADRDLEARAALLDALSGLPPVASVEVVAIQPTGELDAFTDLVGQLDGGGEARFSVRLRAGEPDSWKVVWFQGPGVEWPPRARRRGDSLTSSMPPRDVE